MRPLIALVVGAGLFTALALYAPSFYLEEEGPLDYRLMILIGVSGSLASGAIVVFVAGHQRWMWLGGLLSPFIGSVIYLRVFVAPIGAEQAEDAASLTALLITYVPFVPTAVAGALVAFYVLERRERFASLSVSAGSSDERTS